MLTFTLRLLALTLRLAAGEQGSSHRVQSPQAHPLPPARPAAGPARASIPPGVDPGSPTFTGLANPVPAEPGGAYDPTRSRLQAIFDADVAAGGTSYWFDRMLARPFSTATGETSLFTRGRALYMYTHTPGTLGFAGGYAYR